ncbi:prepilin peptidase [Candidatus Pacearchaeota archaeon]|nr:prepilin peptidase [Candidatus Pacearchaeota archaeon]
MAYDWLGQNIIPLSITYGLAFIALLVGSITDLRTREVPDWVNYGMVISGIALNLLFSVIYSTPSFIINSIIGLAIFFGVAYLMFYAGQWGGGDSKMLMGLGAAIGFDASFKSGQFLLGFFINALFAGAIYGLLWSLALALKNRRKFLKEFRKESSRKSAAKAKKLIIAGLSFMAIILFLIRQQDIKFLVLSLAFLILATFYLWIFVRAIEKSAMYKSIEPKKLTEGDWIVNDIYVGKEYICGPKDLGIEKKQIRKLIVLYKRKRVGKILIKEGIPFVPSFFIAFIVTFLLGNPLIWLV